MEKIKRKYDRNEIVEEFMDFWERTGELPQVHIGTDSQVQAYHVFKFITFVFLYHNSVDPELRIAKGWGLKDFQRAENFSTPGKNRPNVQLRMIEEAAKTLAVAEELVESGIDRENIVIGLDINSDEIHESNKALQACSGMFTGMGYPNVEWKPDSMVIYAADRLSK